MNNTNKQSMPDLVFLQYLAIQAGDIIRRYSTSGAKPEWKEDETPVTAADREINFLVRDRLRRMFPHVSLVGEEGSYEAAGAEYRVFEDSIDGTGSLTVGLSVATFCISVVQGNVPQKALIYEPFSGRMWTATHEGGAFLNGRRLRVSNRATLLHSHVSVIWWNDAAYHLNRACEKVQQAGAQWFNLCSVAICGGLIAGGTMEASLFPGRNGWETAAMQLLVEEAGGRATDIFGNPLQYGPQGEIQGHIISNGLVHDDLVRLVAESQQATDETHAPATS